MTEHVSASTGPHDPSSSAAARWARWSSELHESLASQEATAAELQQDLEDLRRSLDAPALAPTPTPTPTPSQPAAHRSGRKPPGSHRVRPHRSRSLLVGATGVALALAVAVVVALAARPGATASASGPRPSVTRVEDADDRRGRRVSLDSGTDRWSSSRGPTPAGVARAEHRRASGAAGARRRC